MNGSTDHESKAAEQDFKSTELFSSQNEPSPSSPVPKAILHNANDIYLGGQQFSTFILAGLLYFLVAVSKVLNKIMRRFFNSLKTFHQLAQVKKN